MAAGSEVVCAFVNDNLSRPVLVKLAENGVKLIAMRCAGFDKVDLEAARELGLQVVRVPAYSPEAVAEHTVGMMMCLNRRLHKAYQRTRDANFSLDGLVGFNFHGKTIGVIGSGKIGVAAMRIFKGLGMNILCFDPYENPNALELGAKYCSLDELYAEADIISLHCPLTADNKHLLNEQAFNKNERWGDDHQHQSRQVIGFSRSNRSVEKKVRLAHLVLMFMTMKKRPFLPRQVKRHYRRRCIPSPICLS
ncbi:NAD(P)-dependent oxidoreductase [Vibrio sinaloensis]|nr:NAD(P)-dependent oxidoreductase [Vibrio sinaloensis]